MATQSATLCGDISKRDTCASCGWPSNQFADNEAQPLEYLPHFFRSPVSEAEAGVVWRWWDRLTDSERLTLAAMYDDRWEECFFGPILGDDAVSTVMGGRFLADDDAWCFSE